MNKAPKRIHRQPSLASCIESHAISAELGDEVRGCPLCHFPQRRRGFKPIVLTWFETRQTTAL